MKVVILAGGLGTRLSEETMAKPKPLIEIGGRPILWHIMKQYSYWGFNDFIILTGYMSHLIKDYFLNYYTRYSDITIDMSTNSVEILNHRNEPWKVTMLYTGPNTMTGGRLYQAKDMIGNEPFAMTYGDGVSDVNIKELLDFHNAKGKIATLTSVQPTGRFGAVSIDKEGNVTYFKEKPKGDGDWINGGFFILEPQIFDYIEPSENEVFEDKPLKKLAKEGQLNAYKHHGFWRAMDTLRDKLELTDMWNRECAPWAPWKRGNNASQS